MIDDALVDHCNKVLNNDGTNKIINKYDLIVSILSIIGSIVGGILSIFIGGYDNIKSCIIKAGSSTITVLTNFCLFYSHSFLKLWEVFVFYFFY